MNAKMTMRIVACVNCFLLCCSVTRGSLIVSTSGNSTPNLAGYLTYIVTAASEVLTDKLIGFDFVGGGGSFGVFGNFNQVNPLGLPTVFTLDNSIFAFVSLDQSQDTQFMVKSTDGIAITPSESATSLKAAFAYLPAGAAAATNQWSFLQIVTPVNGYFRAIGTLTVRDVEGADRLESVDFVAPIPEPLTISLMLPAAAMCGGKIRRRS